MHLSLVIPKKVSHYQMTKNRIKLYVMYKYIIMHGFRQL